MSDRCIATERVQGGERTPPFRLAWGDKDVYTAIAPHRSDCGHTGPNSTNLIT